MRTRLPRMHAVRAAIAAVIGTLLALAAVAPRPCAASAGPARTPTPSAAGGVTVTMLFTTGEGGHTGCADLNTDIGNVSVANGHLIYPGHPLQVLVRNPPPSPAELIRYVSMDGHDALGDGSCSGGSGTMTLIGVGNEATRVLDTRNVPQNVGVRGSIRLVIHDGGASDQVDAWFTPDPTDTDHLWAAARFGQSAGVESHVFTAVITRGTITASCSVAPSYECARTAPLAVTIDPTGMSFTTNLDMGGNSPCCEYRQYVRGKSKWVYDWIPYRTWGPWAEDVAWSNIRPGGTTPMRYGHRSDTPNISIDSYFPDRVTGGQYYSHDAPGPHPIGGGPFTFTREFEGRLLHVYNPALGCSRTDEELLARWIVCTYYPLFAPYDPPVDCGSGLEFVAQDTSSDSIGVRLPSDRGEAVLPGASYQQPVTFEQTLSVNFAVKDDSLALVIVGSDGLDARDATELQQRASALGASVEGLTPLAGGGASMVDDGLHTWSRLLLFRMPQPLAKVRAHLSGLGQPITLDHDLVLTTDVPAGARAALAWALTADANAERGHTRLRLTAPAAGKCRVNVYDAAGRHVRTLLDAWIPAGTHALEWNGMRDDGGAVAAGVFFVRAEGRGGSAAVRVTVLR